MSRLAVVIAILLALQTIALGQESEAGKYYQQGIEKAKSKDYKDAIKDFGKAIELNPNYAEAYIERGNAKAGLAMYRGAVKDWEKALQLDPTKKDMIQTLIDDANKRISVVSDRPPAVSEQNNPGQANSESAKYGNTIDGYTKELYSAWEQKRLEDMVKAYINRGKTFQEIGNLEEAYIDFEYACGVTEHSKTDVTLGTGSDGNQLGERYYSERKVITPEEEKECKRLMSEIFEQLLKVYAEKESSRAKEDAEKFQSDASKVSEAYGREKLNNRLREIKAHRADEDKKYRAPIEERMKAKEEAESKEMFKKRDEAKRLQEQGMNKYYNGDYKGAIEDFEKAMELDPSIKWKVEPITEKAKAELKEKEAQAEHPK